MLVPSAMAILNAQENDEWWLSSVEEAMRQRMSKILLNVNYYTDEKGNRVLIDIKIFDDIALDEQGRVISQKITTLNNRAEAMGTNVESVKYDFFGRVLEKTIADYTPEGELLERRLITYDSYDEYGRPTRMTVLSYAADGELLKEKQVISNDYTHYGYNELASLDQIQVVYTYDAEGNLAQKIQTENLAVDEYGRVTQQKVSTYDAAGDLLIIQNITNEAFGIAGNPTRMTILTYDSSGGVIDRQQIVYEGIEDVPSAPTLAPAAQRVINADLEGAMAVQDTVTTQANQVPTNVAVTATMAEQPKPLREDQQQK
ncbi:MAG: hypothetical protein NC938_03660 [Candidatus Omnitrophica bacterium]|nr:hypothetical protein [Candidatus Omnitrophota bacterium]